MLRRTAKFVKVCKQARSRRRLCFNVLEYKDEYGAQDGHSILRQRIKLPLQHACMRSTSSSPHSEPCCTSDISITVLLLTITVDFTKDHGYPDQKSLLRGEEAIYFAAWGFKYP